MSQLPQEAIEEFQILWKKHCDEDLTLGEAGIKAHDVFAVLRLALEKPKGKKLVKKDTSPDPAEQLRKMQEVIEI